MKKAKIFLTALAVLAVVGGALAHKVKQPAIFARTCHIPTQTCILNTFQTFETTTDASSGVLVTYELFGAPCGENNYCETYVTISD